jgi:predicted MPP superfamily phosphohydrolase
MQTTNHDNYIILLDHQPYHLEEAEQNGVDLQLSGHTHRGQIFPINLVTDRVYEKSHGYLRKGNSHIYVTSGIGLWGGKFRIGTQSEYLVMEMAGR